MFKKNIKPILMAGALALATAVSPVFAVDVNPDTPEMTPVSINVPISKTLNYQNGVKTLTPKKFKYQVRAGNVYDRATDKPITTGATLTVTNNVEYSFATADLPATYSDGNVTKSNQNINFEENDTTVPGIYSYTIQEVQATDANITYDGNKYTLFVQVTNKDSNPSNGFEFSYVVYEGEVTYESIKNLPNTPKPTNKKESISFVNKYTENEGTLTIRKVIAGSAANAKEDFSFDVYFTAPQNTKNTTYTYTVNGGPATTGDIATNEDGKVQITLKGGQSAVFTGLPTGTTYTITENGATDYDTTYVQKEGNVEKDNSNDLTKKSVESGLVYDLGENSVVFTNTKNSNPITGVIVNNMPYIALLGASGAGLVVLAASKKRSKK